MDKASTSTSIRGASPAPTAVEFEIALLRSLVQFKPTGEEKHVIITRLQSELHRKSGLWLETDDLWGRLGELYDLEALDEMAAAASSSESRAASPKLLSSGSRPARQSASPLSSPSPSPSPRPPSRSADGSTTHDRDERGKLKPGGREEIRRVSDRSKGSSKSKGRSEKVEEEVDDEEQEDEAGPSKSRKGRLSTGDRRRSITAASGATPMSGRKGRDRSSSLSEDEGEDDGKKGKKGSGKRKRESVDQEASKSKARRGEDEAQDRRRKRR